MPDPIQKFQLIGIKGSTHHIDSLCEICCSQAFHFLHQLSRDELEEYGMLLYKVVTLIKYVYMVVVVEWQLASH